MDVVYANQMSVTNAKNEIFIRFSTIHPVYDVEGNITAQPNVSNERIIVLTKEAFEAFKKLINQDMSANEE